MDQTELKNRLYKFALQIVKLVRLLPSETAGYKMGSQLISAGTSVAANYEEATGAFSKSDFTYKISIAFKEAKETNLWLRLIKDSKLFNDSGRIDPLIQESLEIANILGKALKTSRKNAA